MHRRWKKKKKKERKLSSIFKNKSHSFVSKFNDCALKFSERKNRYCVHAYVNSYNKFKQKYNNVINKSKIMANSLLVSAVYSKTRINTNNLNRKKKKKRMKVFASFKTLITSRKNFTYVYTNVFYYTQVFTQETLFLCLTTANSFSRNFKKNMQISGWTLHNDTKLYISNENICKLHLRLKFINFDKRNDVTNSHFF